MRCVRIAKVVLEKTVYRIDRPFDYLIPSSLEAAIKVGCRVTVPFSKTNAKRQGLVIDIENSYDKNSVKEIKEICASLDDKPLLNKEMLGMVKWLKSHTFCTYFDAVKTIIPFGLNIKMVQILKLNQSLNPERLSQLSKTAGCIVAYLRKNNGEAELSAVNRRFSLSENDPAINELIKNNIAFFDRCAKQNMRDPTVKMARLSENQNDFGKLTPKQNSVLQLLFDVEVASVKEICYYTGVTPAVINALVKKGLIELFDAPAPLINNTDKKAESFKKIVLTKEQSDAYDKLKCDLLDGKPKTDLLYGVTGSGKTSVFLKLVDCALENKKSVIVMVPEISLTPQTLSKFKSRYKDRVTVFHSAMSLGQRKKQWELAASGEGMVAIGTRSAVFAPLNNIGLIIMDEEQEHTYKSEKSPRFHARDLAKLRCSYHNALLLLASATPSVESYSLATAGKYGLAKLPHRFGNAVLPEVITVDMRDELSKGNTGIFSKKLIEELEKTFAHKQQAILLLNRRGHNTYVSCPACGTVFTCPNCSISLTYHSANNRLMCHYCGYSKPVVSSCPACKNKKLRFSGAGTQRADEELASLFPKARILRMDADTTMTRDAFERGLTAFAAGEYDIMLGTQMVAKGLDFPNVTLVGVLSADQTMYSDDYRAFERAFSLLTQVIGRSGRGDAHGRAVVQTCNPENDIIALACNQDYESFFKTEIMTRKLMIYPPYCDIFMLGITAHTQALSQKNAALIFKIITEAAQKSKNIKMIILGPSPAAVPKVSGKYRQRLIIKTKNNAAFRQFLDNCLLEFYASADKTANVFVDINPENII